MTLPDPLDYMYLKKATDDVGRAAAKLFRTSGPSASFVRTAAAIAKALHTDPGAREDFIRERAAPRDADRILKAAVSALTVPDASEDVGAWVGDPITTSILGRLNAMEVPALVPILGLTGFTAAFIEEGKAIRLPAGSLDKTTHQLKKVGSLVVATEDFLRFRGAVAALERNLESAIALAIDTAMFDPSNDGSGSAPASLTYAGIELPSVGVDPEDIRSDILMAVSMFAGDFTRAAWIADPQTAIALSLLQAPLGEANIKLDSTGTLYGLPFFISNGVPRDTSGGSLILLDASGMTYSRGSFDLARSNEPTVEMDTAPTNASAPEGQVTETTMVSLWQNNCVGFRAIADITWSLPGGEGRCITITGTDYGGTS